jgi:hypothetical protein
MNFFRSLEPDENYDAVVFHMRNFDNNSVSNTNTIQFKKMDILHLLVFPTIKVL